MKKKYISLFLVILLGMIFNISNIKAYEGTNDVIGQTKFVDKDGNINTVDVYDGTTNEEYNPYARTVSTANMVNFNCSKAKTTTNFTDYYTGQEGYLSKSNAADAAFLGYENGKVKFMISGIVGLVDPQYVEVLSQGTYYASNYEVNSSGDLYHYISNNVNATGNQGNKNYIGTGPSYLTKNKEYYSYDGHYFYDNYNTMITDYKNNVRNNAVNPNNPYYSYFQYLPMRSQTTYTGSQISNYLNNKAGSTSKLYNTGDIFIKYQNKYGVNALMAASFAALESGWGKSNIALNKNNLFGLNATDNNPGGNADTFSTVDDCIMNFTSSWMSKRYLNPTYTSLFRGGYFGDKGSGIFGKYSSDPYEGEKCASIAKNMDASISSKDNDYYTLGIKDIYLTTHTALNVRSSSNTNSSVLYTTIKNPAYSFIIKDASAINDFYKIQSEVASSDGTYSFDNTGYVSNQYVTLLNNTSHPQGWKKENNYWYYYFSNGSKATGLQTIENNLYYFNTSGQMQTGWQEVNNKWYYFDELGYGQKDWKLIGNNWFYFNSSYQMQTGWQEINEKWYYLSTGVMNSYGKTYYEGYMVTGAQTINNKEYYFTSEGVMVRGWHKENDKWKYYSPKKMSIYGRTFVEGEKVTGWLPINDKWYYIAEDGYMVTGIYKVGNRKYLFMEDGSMKTGWFKVDDTWYYISSDGELRAQWVKSLSNWYYVNDEGLILTGDQVINGRQYYFNEDGIMYTGWMQVGNQWKYYSQGTLKIYGKTFVDGEKVTGWLPLGNRWYYIANDDYMVTGYYKVGNSTYYFDESGLMKTGWFKINGEDYYAASSGTIQAQWVKSGRNWYYVDTDGKMVTGDYIIDGTVNRFDNQGLWMN